MEFFTFILGILIGAVITYFYFKQKFSTLDKFKQQINKQLKNDIIDSISQAMQRNNTLLAEFVKNSIDNQQKIQQSLLEQQNSKISEIISPLKENLYKYQQLIENFAQKNAENFGKYTQKLTQIIELEKELKKQNQLLTNTLKSPLIRGKWAEIQLKRLFELTGMIKYIDYQEQKTTQTTRHKPDFTIRLPDNKKIIIDSKLPLTNYIKAIESNDQQKAKFHLNEFIKDFTHHITLLSKKEYWKKYHNNLEFVIMYVHIESALIQALDLDKDLINKALEKRIIITTPFTLMALLQTIAFIWKQATINENAKKIISLTQNFANNITEIINETEKLTKKLKEAINKQEQINLLWQKKITPILQKIKDMGFIIDKTQIE